MGGVFPVDGKCPEGKAGYPPLVISEYSGECVGQVGPPTELSKAKNALAGLFALAEAGDPMAQRLIAGEVAHIYELSGVTPRELLSFVSPGGSGFEALGGRPSVQSPSIWLGVTTRRQINSYYCGPATVETILRYLGPQTSATMDTTDNTYPAFTSNSATNQARLANPFWLATDRNRQTGWGPQYIPFALNTWRGSDWYVQAATPNLAGGTLTKAQAWINIRTDMLYRHPVAENVKYNDDTYVRLGSSAVLTSGIGM